MTLKVNMLLHHCHAEAGAMNLLRPTPDRLTKHLLPMHTVEAVDELT